MPLSNPYQLPTELDVRLSVLGGSEAALFANGINDNEIVFDTTENQLLVGNGGDLYRAIDSVSLDFLLHLPGISYTNLAKSARFSFVGTTSPVVNCKSDTGYAKVMRWDGTFGAVAGSGNPASTLVPSFGSAPVSPYNTFVLKYFAVFPCLSNGTISGNLTSITNISGTVVDADFTSCSSLASVGFSQRIVGKYLDLSKCPITTYNETTFTAPDGNPAKVLKLGNKSLITFLQIGRTNLKYFSTKGMNLSTFYFICPNCTVVELSGFTNPTSVQISAPISTLDLTYIAKPSLTNLLISSDSLLGSVNLDNIPTGIMQLHFAGCTGITGFTNIPAIVGGAGTCDISLLNCNLNSTELNNFYTALGTASGGKCSINVTGNPGTSADTPSIATNKGWIVTG